MRVRADIAEDEWARVRRVIRPGSVDEYGMVFRPHKFVEAEVTAHALASKTAVEQLHPDGAWLVEPVYIPPGETLYAGWYGVFVKDAEFYRLVGAA